MPFASGLLGILIAVFVVLFGLAFGSFLNVCITRLPRHESLVRPRSRCPRCGALIRALDNIPLLSWILLRGRCRHCHQPIAWRYPAVEFAMAALFLLCYLRFGLTITGIGNAILCFLLLGLAVMDAETLRLPDTLTWPGIVLGVVASGVTGGVWEDRLGGGFLPFGSAGTGSETWFPLPFGLEAAIPALIASALWALAAGLFLLLIRWLYRVVRHREGLGMGDIKLLAMIAAWLGPAPTLLTLLLACVAAALYGLLTVMLFRDARPIRTARLPLGSFLCTAALYTIFAGDPIIAWYLKFFQ